MSENTGIRYTDAGVEMSVSDRGALLYFPGDKVPFTVDVADFARIAVAGDQYWAWDPDNPKARAAGGMLGDNSSGRSEHIAHILRRCIPANDPRWSDEIPDPFFASRAGLA